MKHTILSVLEKLTDIIEHDYALFELTNPKISAPFLSLGSFLDTSDQLEDEQLADLAALYMCAQGVKKVDFSISGMRKHDRGFSVRGSGDALYVDSVHGDDRLQPGDKILTLSGSTPAVFRSRSLMMNGVLPISDRDEWGPILRHASFCSVMHADGSEEKLTLRLFPTDTVSEFSFRCLSGTDILYFTCNYLDGSDECEDLLDAFTEQAMQSSKLIIDLRQCTGGDAESFGRLAAVLPSGSELPANVHEIYYSPKNCDIWEQNLTAIGMNSPEYADLIAELKGELSIVRGNGFAPGESDTDITPAPAIPGERKIVILCDYRTADEAESFIALARHSENVTVLGRITSGRYCLSHVIRTGLGFGCSVSYPMGAFPDARRHGALGIEPDILVDWTPEEITRDILLEWAVQLQSVT